jgi:hypothetical protein
VGRSRAEIESLNANNSFHGLPFTSSTLFATGAGFFTSFFHAQSPNVSDHELSAGAEATASSFLACCCSDVGDAVALAVMGAGLAVLEAAAAAAAAASSLINVSVKGGESE